MSPTVHEDACVFDCRGERLLGIVARPSAPAAAVGVVVVVGGPQVRAGSHRQFVQLARALAAAGFAVLRFDARGMGDSSGEAPGFEALQPDIDAAIGALTAQVPEVRRVVLWGLCDAASAALLYLGDRRADARVAGLCLLNPWVRTEAGIAKAHVRHYYLARLGELSFWRKLLAGGVGAVALRGLFDNLRRSRAQSPAVAAAPYPERMAAAWQAFDGPRLLVLSGRDLTAREFELARDADRRWLAGGEAGTVQRLPDADHTISDPASRARLETLCVEWLRGLMHAAGRRPQKVAA